MVSVLLFGAIDGQFVQYVQTGECSVLLRKSLNKFRVENKSGHYLNTGCVDDIPPSVASRGLLTTQPVSCTSIRLLNWRPSLQFRTGSTLSIGRNSLRSMDLLAPSPGSQALRRELHVFALDTSKPHELLALDHYFANSANVLIANAGAALLCNK